METRHPLPSDRPARCPAGCGKAVDFSDPLPACADCGKRLCLSCVYYWTGDDDRDVPLCKRDWRRRQAESSLRGGVDRDGDT